MVNPSCRHKMAQQAVAHHAISIRLACRAFSISETYYRYRAQLTEDNTGWGLGLCFSYLRHVGNYAWNHKRVLQHLM